MRAVMLVCSTQWNHNGSGTKAPHGFDFGQICAITEVAALTLYCTYLQPFIINSTTITSIHPLSIKCVNSINMLLRTVQGGVGVGGLLEPNHHI